MSKIFSLNGFIGYQIQAVGKHSCSMGKIDFSFSRLYLFDSLISYFFVWISYSANVISSDILNNLNLTSLLSSIDSPIDSPKAMDLMGAWWILILPPNVQFFSPKTKRVTPKY